MTIRYISRDELLELFIRVSLDKLLGNSLPEAIEEVIPRMPLEQQKRAYEEVQGLKEHPQTLSAFKSDDDIPKDISIDYDSEEYRCFIKVCEELTVFFEAHQEMIAETYSKDFAKTGIKLIVNW